jgi:hypothetical protein
MSVVIGRTRISDDFGGMYGVGVVVVDEHGID